MFNKLDAVVQRFEQLTEKLADPSIYDRQEELKKVSEERANIEPIVEAYKHYKKVKQELEESKDLIKSEKDGEMIELLKEEIAEKNKAIPNLESELKVLLLPKDPDDDKNVMVEIRAGAGGDEASIFVGDVYRMYQNFLKELGFKSELVSVSKGDEGLKEIIFSINIYHLFIFFLQVFPVQMQRIQY